MRTIVSVAIAAAIVALGSGVALAQSAEPAKVGESAKGKTLVDAKGMTLYILDRDNNNDQNYGDDDRNSGNMDVADDSDFGGGDDGGSDYA